MTNDNGKHADLMLKQSHQFFCPCFSVMVNADKWILTGRERVNVPTCFFHLETLYCFMSKVHEQNLVHIQPTVKSVFTEYFFDKPKTSSIVTSITFQQSLLILKSTVLAVVFQKNKIYSFCTIQSDTRCKRTDVWPLILTIEMGHKQFPIIYDSMRERKWKMVLK